ncbi:MAG: DEAD/DEAH box helicase family protein [Lachnospiraceae bacterium]|nr:DEAD/DEAH box helicase family protein [Lachnospiraceae bacterium]
MLFTDLEIKEEYRSLQDDIVGDFYTPVLKCAKKYQRAVGFFSSTALIEISQGISGLVKNGGTIELVASPKLSEDDVVAIEKGLKLRDEVIKERIAEAIAEPKNKYEESRLNYLINLIAYGILDIKIAVLDDSEHIGMYHEKVGLMYDEAGNTLAFSGSMNESTTAFMHNCESIDVFKSWEGGSDARRVMNKQLSFKAIWENYEPHMSVLDFPEAAKEKLFQYRKSDKIDHNDANITEREPVNEVADKPEEVLVPHVPKWVTIRPYQEQAIENWQNRNYVGIFDMATGTGKTYTGLAAVVKLYENRKAPLAVLIVCPYQHLVNQWVEDIVTFGMKPVICHSASTQKKWKNRLKDACLSLELGITDNICAIFTNATYGTEFVQNTIAHIKSQAVLVVDEAHNFGAVKASKDLDERIPYRLALSATLERHGDDAGTKKLFDYFGDKCIEYTLKEAIDNDMLVRYYYHPIVVSFKDDELEAYLEISKQIAQAMMSCKDAEPSDYAKMLMIKRARMVAAAREKVERLVEEMQKHSKENHMLVYCGATTMRDIDYDEEKPPEEDKRQVDIVTEILGNSLDMKVAKFTSEETAEQREKLKSEFDEGESLQTLIAIRCLDEGVNIPSIRKAFILASSTNPKEYIQRRGRVLRKYKGKMHADIYDFVVSPLPLDCIDAYDEETIRLSQSLVKREIVRMKDFADLAENTSVADDYIYTFIDRYGIDLEEDTDGFE